MSNWSIKQVTVISGDGVGLTTVGINGVVKIIDMVDISYGEIKD